MRSSPLVSRLPNGPHVRLRYRGIGPFATRGVCSRRLYACGGCGAIVNVEPRDVEALLHTRRFTRASPVAPPRG